MDFVTFFHRAMGHIYPYEYQRHLAESPMNSRAIRVPTGSGKTAATVLAWLWKRQSAPAATPRRLVYMLPTRVLVEQTYRAICGWIDALGMDIDVSLLMGGEVEQEWETHPERPLILVGTQDMLLSRTLNRGYAMSRYQWPVHFGLLNNDALIVCDEVQLMSSGLATSLQLQAWRKRMGCSRPSLTWWMSATLNLDWLNTVDHASGGLEVIELSDQDRRQIEPQYKAPKPIEKIDACNDSEFAALAISRHRPDSLTLVVVNAVERAKSIYAELQKRRKKNKTIPDPLLLHSRFREYERRNKREHLESTAREGGIVISTQVIEAGVDISCRTMITEVAPWASLVQRFGRCNRRGEFPEGAQIIVVDATRPTPYEKETIDAARHRIANLDDAALDKLAALPQSEDRVYTNVIRRKDLLDLFDTTPDLSGADVDISRFIREGEDRDAHVYWRDFGSERPGEDERRPAREELCPVPAESLESFAKSVEVFRYDWLDGKWSQVTSIYPGQVYLLRASDGGYSELGWDPRSKEAVEVLGRAEGEGDAYTRDRLSSGPLRSIAEHTDNVCRTLEEIVRDLGLSDCELTTLKSAARWHDWGKAHPVFQKALVLPDGTPEGLWAKGTFRRYERACFRHELASALALLATKNGFIPEELKDLVAYLVAAHHGKVRLSIRSMPSEKRPKDPQMLFARGIYHNDHLAETDLGAGVIAPGVDLDLSCMRAGLDESGNPSWSERMLALRDHSAWGPFRLAYLEAVLRAADRRASAAEGDDHA
jgi:CRISPR-associated endonuclease/helicase Cas3